MLYGLQSSQGLASESSEGTLNGGTSGLTSASSTDDDDFYGIYGVWWYEQQALLAQAEETGNESVDQAPVSSPPPPSPPPPSPPPPSPPPPSPPPAPAVGCCYFEYLDSLTPKITGVSVSSSTMTITGTSFSATVSDNTVSVGPFPVTVSSASTTQLVVSVADLPAGTHVVDVFVAGSGYATGSTSARSHTVTPTVTAVSPAMSSVSGGASVTVTGTGFDHTNASANNVDFCYSDCAVESVSATTIVCTSGALVNSAKYDIGRPLQPWNLVMLLPCCLGVQFASLLFLLIVS